MCVLIYIAYAFIHAYSIYRNELIFPYKLSDNYEIIL